MKKQKHKLLSVAIVVSILCSSVTTFARQLPSGGGTECPDRCISDDVNCCIDPKKEHCIAVACLPKHLL